MKGIASILAVPSAVYSQVSGARLRVELDAEDPSKSRAWLVEDPDDVFPVGFGKHGYKKEGSTFEAGHSLLGEFRINAILTSTSFRMEDSLVSQSGKSHTWLEENLFSNMSSIDFDGDGKGGEYGDGFIGLEPLSPAPQPFHFGEYKGVFRWYTYAIHGTQDESRVGKCITGGCVNVGKEDIARLASRLRLGDRVEILASPPG